jgi:exopolysaccharide production protein ExoZ
MFLGHQIKMAQERLDSIQILRACAALAVMFAHLWPTLAGYGTQDAIPNFIFGASGVDLFFVISGFIMVYVSETAFATRGAPLRFLKARLLRIVPLYWAMTTVLLIMSLRLAAPFPHVADILSSYLFVPMVRADGTSEPVLGVGWTLNYEMFFYACFAITIMLPRRAAVTALSVGLFAFTYAGSHFSFMMHGPLSIWSASMICEFCFGMWIALAFREGLRIPVAASIVIVALGLALMIYAYTGNFSVVSRTIGWGGGAALIVASLALSDTMERVPRILSPLVTVGEASFALYLVHSMVPTAFVVLRIPSFFPRSYPLCYCALLISTSIAAAMVLTRWDIRLRKRILQFGSPPRYLTSHNRGSVA